MWEVLSAVNLHLERNMIQEIVWTVRGSYEGGVSISVDPLLVMACTALVGESKRLPNMADKGEVTAGPTIETIMRLLKTPEKTLFLEKLDEFTLKRREFNEIGKKVKEVNRTYLKYQTYNHLFWELSEAGHLEPETAPLHCSILWLAYLEAKLTHTHPVTT